MNILYYFIKRKSVITFDIFDTLVERKIDNPSDIFHMVGRKILGDEKAELFKKDRINAEETARKFANGLEVNIDDIYMNLKEKYMGKCNILKQQEIQEEIEMCMPKEKMVKAFNYAISQKKEVYIISDMYLPKSVIEKILIKCGITGQKEIYVSCECGMNKISGKLFQYVIYKNKLQPHQLLHIGDSVKADCLGAAKSKIQFYLISRKNRIGRIIHR